MDELLKLLQSLPPPALVVFAFVLAIIVGVRYLGLWQGQNAPAQGSAAAAQVAAVIVDPTALNKAAAEVAGLAVSLTEATVVARSHNETTDKLTDAIEDLSKRVDRLTDKVIDAAAKLK
jgi:hypothetical protein